MMSQSPTPDLFNQLPPHNLEAEVGVLGSILLDASMCDEVALILKPFDFYVEAHELLFKRIIEIIESAGKVDPLILANKLKDADELEKVGGEAYIAKLMQSTPHAAHAVHYAKMVEEKSMHRAVIHAANKILSDAFHSNTEAMDLIGQAEQEIFSIYDSRGSDNIVDAEQLMIETYERIDARSKGAVKSSIKSGFHELDGMTGGFHENELVILGARPSMGKTALALNFVENVILVDKRPVLFVSLEMGRVELAQRLMSSQAKIESDKFRTGYLTEEDNNNFAVAAGVVGQSPLFIDDSPQRTVSQIGAVARRIQRRKGDLGLIAIDYLQLLSPDDPRDPRQEQVAKMARRLKGIARELHVPVLCLSQLNRQTETGGTKADHRPKLAQLRESGAIEQDADVVLFIHREEYYLSDDDPKMDDVKGMGEIIIAKQRAGPTGTVDVTWMPKYTRFGNLAKTHVSDGFGD